MIIKRNQELIDSDLFDKHSVGEDISYEEFLTNEMSSEMD